jgi:FixJ family two-component response regulator
MEPLLDQKDKTVSIVDDDESVRKALKRLIKVAGFKAKTFGSAREFIDSGLYQSTGVLVLDVRMPGMSGLELQKNLTDSGSDIPIIFITAHEDVQLRQMALEAGALAFLKKPFEDKALLDVVQRALG